MDKYSLPICTEVFSASVEKPSVFEMILPEYCPGIKKILKADAVTGVPDCTFSGGIINVSTPCDVRVVYTAENGSLKSVSFSHTVETALDASKITAESGDVKIFSKVNIPKVYVKLKSARSAEAKLEAPVSVSAYIFEETPLFVPNSTGDTETRCVSETMTKRTITESSGSEISDIITLDSSLPAASELTDRSLSLFLNGTECKDGGIKYKGIGIFKCTYKTSATPDSSDSEYIYLKKEIPFEGEIQHDSITPSSSVLVDIALNSLDVTISADPYGENRIIGVNGTYGTHTQIFNNKEVEFTHDGFCAMYECDFENTVYGYDKLTDVICKNDNMKEIIPLNGANLTEITDSELRIGTYSTEFNDRKVYAVAKMYAVITGSDDKGEPICIEHRFTVRQNIDDTALTTDRKYIICCQTVSGEISLKDGELTLDYIFKTDGAVLEKKCITAISEALISYDKPKPLCRSEYIIYYPDKHETLWDIAKKYEIPQKQLAAANGMETTQTLNKKTVLIPCIM